MNKGLKLPPDDELAVMVFQHITPYTESLWKFHHNHDETKVGRYTLPEIKSATAEDWEKLERPALLQSFKDLMYGEMPPAPDRLRLELLAQKNDALDNTAIRKEIRIHCEMENGQSFDFDMLLYVPKHVKTPPPVFVGLNFSGNQSNTPENDVLMTRSMFREPQRGFLMTPYTEDNRGKSLDTWNYVEAMKRGYAVATVAYGDICPDHINGLRVSPFTLFYPDKELRPDYEAPFFEVKHERWKRKVGAIGTWAWGLSRMLDALEKEPLVDSKKAAVLGHSRNGKAALWAGACDQRFTMVISNNSGCGGATLSRRNFGETLKLLYFCNQHWLCGMAVDYIERVNELPIDQHQLLALIAPRKLYVASATMDFNADPKGEFLAAKAASPVWALYGEKGLGVKTQPSPDKPVGHFLRYHLRIGEHAITEWDWEQYYNFADSIWHSRAGQNI